MEDITLKQILIKCSKCKRHYNQQEEKILGELKVCLQCYDLYTEDPITISQAIKEIKSYKYLTEYRKGVLINIIKRLGLHAWVVQSNEEY